MVIKVGILPLGQVDPTLTIRIKEDLIKVFPHSVALLSANGTFYLKRLSTGSVGNIDLALFYAEFKVTLQRGRTWIAF